MLEMTLCCYYDPRFQPVIRSFAAETARAMGASEREVYEISIAMEEATNHILENHPTASLDEGFDVICRVTDDGLMFILKNMGLPVDARPLPCYDVERPEDTLEGLSLHLIEKLVDRYEFVNLGNRGWRTVLFKKIGNLEIPSSSAGPDQEDLSEMARQKLAVRRATPQDAPAIVELAYRNYHYTYAKETFYFVDRLREELQSERVVSMVALNPSGTMIGQVAILASPGCPEIAEVGALMVLPEYRRSLGLLQMIKLAQRYVNDEATPFTLYESNFVTAHTISQKAGSLFHFQPMALKLSVHARAAYQGMEGVNPQRESHLYSVVSRNLLPSLEMYVPRVHASITRTLFQRIGAEPVCLSGEEAIPEGSRPTELKIHIQSDFQAAVVTVIQAGPDLLSRLRRSFYEIEIEEIKTITVKFPTWKPSVQGIEDHSEELQIFFSGFVAESIDRWYILYTQLNRQRFDFNEVQLADPSALDLRAYVEFCRERILPR